ncbi:hypothetical protein [Actinomadura sp. K4S16]|uniref:hypothetical protein n=1 Tax=Actinomadura sp. K4S16 TaxID=1316147 RepID=UPI0011EF1F74|nr:hypothetical protein [Actinomadura sp. K4S16]
MSGTPDSEPLPVEVEGEGTRVRCAYHAGEGRRKSTATAVDTAGSCACVEVFCKAESDGFHEHIYEVGLGGIFTRARVEHGLHSWMDEWQADYPDRTAFTLTLPRSTRDFPSLEAAFAHLGIPRFPAPACTIDTEGERS